MYSVISLFSGCGGLDLGFRGGFKFLGKNYRHLNFDIQWANDVDSNACFTYREFFNHEIVCKDIADVLTNKIKSDLFEPEMPLSTDVVIGGFPCQDFSHAGNRKGFSCSRGNMYLSMGHVIERTRPKLFLAENVKGLLTLGDGAAIKKITKDFKNIGYNVEYRLFMTADFGVPQKRERVLIIGTRDDILPSFIFAKPVLPKSKWITLESAIGDLEDLKEGQFENHFWSKAKKNNGQGNNCVKKDAPGPTMRAEHHGNIEFHWNGKRRLSAREAARIQSFPDDLIFLPSTSSAYKQIGNAVPPVFAWHMARSIQSFLKNNE